MRGIDKAVIATPFGPTGTSMRLFRVIGTVDIDGKGTLHEIGAVDPFIFLDDGLVEGELPVTFSKHPHQGLTAVTYLLEGTSHAWDNKHGNTPDLNHAGGVYFINSGKGVVHGEAPTTGVRKLRTLQLWFNPGIYQRPLPDASYQLYQPAELPVYQDDKLWARVIIGAGFDLQSPVNCPWPLQYMHIKLQASDYQFSLPDPTWQGFIYVIQGEGVFGEEETHANAQTCLVLDSQRETELPIKNTGEGTLEFIIATGKAHNKGFYKLLGHGGAIVADTEENARQAMLEYEADPESYGL